MIKRFWWLLLLPSISQGTAITSAQNGNWGTTSTWIGGVVPGNGDTISVFHTITVSDQRIVGTSPAAGTVVVNLNSTGTLHLTTGGYLKVRGDVRYTAGSSNTTDGVDIDGGATFEFDASGAASPLSQNYGYYPTATNGYRKFKVSGSAGVIANLQSNSGGGQANLTENGQSDGGVYELLYASVTNMGFNLSYNNGGSPPTKWDASHSSFTNCGVINAGGSMQSNAYFRHQYNAHVNTTGGYTFAFNFGTFNDGTGTRSISNNVFDAALGNTVGFGDFVITNNFIGSGYGAYFSTWSLFTNNFVRLTTANSTINADITDTYFWWDADQQNPHVLTQVDTHNTTINGAIWGQSGKSRSSGADDSGEFYLQQGPTSISTYTIKNSIFLGNGAGYSSLEMTSLLGSAGNSATWLNNRAVFEHNTWFGGFDNSTGNPFAAIDYSETANMSPGTLSSFRSNILWNPQDATRPAHFLKAFDIGNYPSNLAAGYGTGPTQDVCSPSKCDYNGSYGVSTVASGGNTATFTNQGKGYAGKFSSTPGTHDVDSANPVFTDYKRYFEKFDSAYYRPYLGIGAASAWASGSTYSVGNVVAHSSSTYYWGDTLNYRYINASGCSSGNPEPGAGALTSWNKCWEFASVKDLKDGLINGITFTDPATAASNSDIHQAILKWIRAGYSPTNQAYKGTAHDGTDIGAVAVAVTPSFAAIIGHSMSTSTIMDGTIQFTSTDAVTWSLVAGSTGTINASGLYAAPTTYITPKNVEAGCQIFGNDHVYNTRIDNLPVDSNSASRIAHILGGAPARLEFEPSFPHNVVSQNTPMTNMSFRSTSYPGPYPVLPFPYRGEENSTIPNNPLNGDHHILMVSTDTCQFYEMYQFYPTGTDPVAPTSNSAAGVKYNGMSYDLPDVSHGDGGATDAAGMQIQPLALRYSELKAGSIKHALRFTMDNGDIYSGNVWPATAFTFECNTLSTCFPYGARLRLKASYNISGFSPAAQTILTALKQYGMFMADGGTALRIQTMSDITADTITWNSIWSDFAFQVSSVSQTDLEQVDESSLMVSTASGKVSLNNPYVVPDNFAEVIATKISNGSTSTVRVAIQMPTAGTFNTPFVATGAGMSVMGGTPQFSIPAYVNGSTDTVATCSMSPAVGTLTSGCAYTAPSAFLNRIATTTITITPRIAPWAAISFPLVVFSSDGIRMREGIDAAGNYGPDANGNLWFLDPIGTGNNFYTKQFNSPTGSWPSTPDIGLYYYQSYGSGDKFFSAMVPNGTYLLQVGAGVGNSPSDVNASTVTLDSQGTVFGSSVTLATSVYTPKSFTSVVTVTNNQFYWAMRGNDDTSHDFLNNWSLTPLAPPATNSQSDLGSIIFRNGVILR